MSHLLCRKCMQPTLIDSDLLATLLSSNLQNISLSQVPSNSSNSNIHSHLSLNTGKKNSHRHTSSFSHPPRYNNRFLQEPVAQEVGKEVQQSRASIGSENVVHLGETSQLPPDQSFILLSDSSVLNPSTQFESSSSDSRHAESSQTSCTNVADEGKSLKHGHSKKVVGDDSSRVNQGQGSYSSVGYSQLGLGSGSSVSNDHLVQNGGSSNNNKNSAGKNTALLSVRNSRSPSSSAKALSHPNLLHHSPLADANRKTEYMLSDINYLAGIPHPLCQDCSDVLSSTLDKKLEELRSEKTAYENF